MYLLIVFLPLLGSGVAGFFGRFLGKEGSAMTGSFFIISVLILLSSIFLFRLYFFLLKEKGGFRLIVLFFFVVLWNIFIRVFYPDLRLFPRRSGFDHPSPPSL